MASTSKARPPTPEQILMFGHIAAALRQFMETKGWGPAQLNKAMGKESGYSLAYQLINGKSAPGPKFRPLLMKITGLTEEQLTKRDKNEVVRPSAIVTYKPSKPPIISTRLNEVLTFSITADGKARIKLDVVLSLDSATPLLRMLLDAGVIFGEKNE